jgi:superfamily II DNA/RNA helicase
VSTSFADLGVPAHIVASLVERGIDEPFPIQALTLPDVLAGRDVSGRAPTGSGKTLAFGIPLVVDCPRARPGRPTRLVLVPTRELATQVATELRLLAGNEGPRVEAVFGGVPIGRQATAFRRGVDIVVACPGRLADVIDQRIVRLDDVEMVVLDEADRMADMGFLPEVRRLLDRCNPQRRTVLFSATLDGDVDVLVRNYQHDPVRHELHVPEEDAPDVDHHFWATERTERVAVAAKVVSRMGPTVVFCRTKRGADRVSKQLNAAGVGAVAIHGDRSQGQRDRALEQFRDGRADALVATDVAARGIHVDDVAAVIHFDPPEDHKDYVHRSGRTARAGRRGVVVSLVTSDKASLVKGLQRRLDLPTGLTGMDLASLGEPAPRQSAAAPSNRRSRSQAKREQREERGEVRTDRAGSDAATGDADGGQRRPRRDGGPRRHEGGPRRPRPNGGRGGGRGDAGGGRGATGAGRKKNGHRKGDGPSAGPSRTRSRSASASGSVRSPGSSGAKRSGSAPAGGRPAGRPSSKGPRPDARRRG